jgi:hypothetical protein
MVGFDQVQASHWRLVCTAAHVDARETTGGHRTISTAHPSRRPESRVTSRAKAEYNAARRRAIEIGAKER